VFLQATRDAEAAKRFMKRVLRSDPETRRIVTDRLASYRVARRTIALDAIHETGRNQNNRIERSHETTRLREYLMRRFKSARQAQRFVTVQSAIANLFNLGRHLLSSAGYQILRLRAFAAWNAATVA
jgi:putative transposase